MRPHHKFDMVSIQNATLAGGVAVGSSADLVIQSWGALLIGVVAGFVSVAGYVYLSPALSRCMGLHDTCGVHNLHGIPGILGGVSGAISAAVADTRYETIFYCSVSTQAQLLTNNCYHTLQYWKLHFNTANSGDFPSTCAVPTRS